MRKLNKSIVAGGVVYPAGAAGPDVEAAVANPAHWDDHETPHASEVTVGLSPEDAVGLEEVTRLAALRTSQVDALLSAVSPLVDVDPDDAAALYVSVLETEGGLDGIAESIAAFVTAEQEIAGGDPTGGEPAVDYSAMSRDDLEAEVARRDGDGRTTPLEVGGRGNKPDLVAALTADDEA